jgi:hypothetical protein
MLYEVVQCALCAADLNKNSVKPSRCCGTLKAQSRKMDLAESGINPKAFIKGRARKI